jgi:hypothetical protein
MTTHHTHSHKQLIIRTLITDCYFNLLPTTDKLESLECKCMKVLFHVYVPVFKELIVWEHEGFRACGHVINIETVRK